MSSLSGRTRTVSSALLVTSCTVILAVAGCTRGPAPTITSAPGASTVLGTVALPPPDARGPTITIEGTTSWVGATPGCVMVQTASGQVFQLTGAAVSTRLGAVRAGTAAATQRLRLTGYIPKVGASVCGAVRSFVVEKVTVEGQ